MQGLLYVLTFFAILILLVILDKFINRGLKDELLKDLEEGWGKINDSKLKEEELERIKYYYDRIKEETDVDDITWNDLDMDRIYNRINICRSSIGSEYLYALLRKLKFNITELKNNNQLVKLFSDKKETRVKLQLILNHIGKNEKISIYEYLTRMKEVASYSCLINKVQVILLLVSILGIVLNYMPALYLCLLMIGVNVGTYYHHRAKIAPYLSFFSYIVRLNKDVEALQKIEADELKDYQSRLKVISKKLVKLRKGAFWLTQGSVSGTFVDTVMDYIKMIFHVDIIKFYKMLEVIKNNQDTIQELYEIIGLFDSSIAVASYRESLAYYSEPILEDTQNIKYSVEEVYHPLIKEPISNSINEHSSVLLTGSNASGKSTFIKTLAINAILSQTIYTSVSKNYVAPFYQIYTSMALRDSLFSGESYYMVEIKSLKRIMNANHPNRPILCFVDEVLRGTNTLERISASAHILTHIAKDKAMCFAATHDIELTKILSQNYKNYHFQEKIMDNDVKFDYKLYEGEAKSRNAIKLLKMIGYSDEIVNNASNMAERFLNQGVWEL